MTQSAAEQLKAIWLTSLFPNRYKPRQAAYALQAHAELAKLCRLRVVAPVMWPDRWLGKGAQPDYRDPPEVSHPVYYYPPRIGRNLHGRFLFHCAWPDIRRAAEGLDPQVLLASFVYPDAYAGMLAARKLGIPLVVHARGSDLMILGDHPGRRPLIQQTLRAAAQVVTVSEALARKAVELGADPAKVSHVPNGVDQVRFHPQDRQGARAELELPAEGRLLLFVGNLVPVKGLSFLLEALNLVPGAGLVMVGDGPLRGALEEQASRLGLAERVIWAGPKGHGDIPCYMAASDALVLSSLSEGEPNVVLEALSSGRPVAASRVGGVPGMITPGLNGYMAEPGDAESLATALKQVLEQSWDPGQVAKSVERRSWAATAQGYLEALKKAADRG